MAYISIPCTSIMTKIRENLTDLKAREISWIDQTNFLPGILMATT